MFADAQLDLERMGTVLTASLKPKPVKKNAAQREKEKMEARLIRQQEQLRRNSSQLADGDRRCAVCRLCCVPAVLCAGCAVCRLC